MNLKLAFMAVLMALALLEATEAKGKKSKNHLKKGKSGKPRVRTSKMARGSVVGKIDAQDKIVLKCQFLERNFGEGARGIQVRKCKVKRPQKQKLRLTCEYGDFLCDKCDAEKCFSFNKNKKTFLYQIAKKVVAGIKQDPITKEFYCGAKTVAHEEDSCRLSFPFSSNLVPYKPKTTPPTTAFPPTEFPSEVAEEKTVHKNCEEDPHQFFCNVFMSWSDTIFNQPFEN